MGISAWHLLKNRHVEIAKRSLRISALFGITSILATITLGDALGYFDGRIQPSKLAAMEAIWETEPAPASFSLIAFPSQSEQKNYLELKIPFAILVGILSVSMAIYQGGTMIMNRAEGPIYERARRAWVAFGCWHWRFSRSGGLCTSQMDGYVITGGAVASGAANPLHKTVDVVSGAWFNNFRAFPILWIIPFITYAAMLTGFIMVRRGRSHS